MASPISPGPHTSPDPPAHRPVALGWGAGLHGLGTAPPPGRRDLGPPGAVHRAMTWAQRRVFGIETCEQCGCCRPGRGRRRSAMPRWCYRSSVQSPDIPTERIVPSRNMRRHCRAGGNVRPGDDNRVCCWPDQGRGETLAPVGCLSTQEGGLSGAVQRDGQCGFVLYSLAERGCGFPILGRRRCSIAKPICSCSHCLF